MSKMEICIYKIAIILALLVPIVCSQNTPNVTLETKYETNTGWKLPRDSIPRWFEYYNSTSDFRTIAHFSSSPENVTSCASVSQDFSSLAESDGIWVSCQDPELPPECHVVPESCHPVLTYNTGLSVTPGMRTIEMKFALYGFAILRLTANAKCFDYTYRDTILPGPKQCDLLGITSEMESDGWIYSQFSFDPLLNDSFNSFSLEMIAISAQDVVLLDKIEATEYLLCGPDTFCTTTPLPPTFRPTVFPPFTPGSTTVPNITDIPTRPPGTRISILESSNDAVAYLGWTIPCTSSFPRWLDYYHNVNQFLLPSHDQNMCADAFILESVSTNFRLTEGIWAACKDPELSREECVISSRAPCHPFIRFGQRGLDVNEAVRGIEISYFLFGQATIRLTLEGGKCIEYSKYQDRNSPCDFFKAPANPNNLWGRVYYEPDENLLVRNIQIDMIAKNDHDFVLIDEVALRIFEACEYTPEGCPEFVKTTTLTEENTMPKLSPETESSASTTKQITTSSSSSSSPTFKQSGCVIFSFCCVLLMLIKF